MNNFVYVCAIDLQRLTSFNVVSGLFCSVVVVPMHVLGCMMEGWMTRCVCTFSLCRVAYIDRIIVLLIIIHI